MLTSPGKYSHACPIIGAGIVLIPPIILKTLPEFIDFKTITYYTVNAFNTLQLIYASFSSIVGPFLRIMVNHDILII